jgi:DNA-binding SARP family transcriptional activator
LAYLHISLFGTFQVTVRGRHAVPIESDKAQALLAYLALEADQHHRRDLLAALLWPDADGHRARQSLRQSLYILRRALDSPTGPSAQATNGALFETSRQHIRFSANGRHWLDVTAFTALLDQCQAHPHQRLDACPHCAARLQCAVDLYRGDLLAGLSLADCPHYEEWRLARQERLHSQALHALQQLAVHYERRRDYARAAHVVQQELSLEPWREEAHRRLMRVLALGGQRSAALAQYRICRRILSEELGVAPSAEMAALHQLVLAGSLTERGSIALDSRRGMEVTNPYKGLHAFGETDAADLSSACSRLCSAHKRIQYRSSFWSALRAVANPHWSMPACCLTCG